ncbi:MAG: hypothetical protein L0215_14770 [Gemmataceae bacterium]|nr:hypothetical protein [Gemmataceae bacterium]
MKGKVLIGLGGVLALLIAGYFAFWPTASKLESQAVAKAFEEYRSALLNQDGKAAVACVSSTTLKMYQEYRDLAVSGDEQTIKNLSMINRMQVLLIRHRMDPKLLVPMDGQAVFAHGVDQNWIGKNSVVRAGLQDIAVSGPRATARVTAEGKPTRELFHFVKEGDRWTLDLVPTIKATDQVLQLAARNKGMKENVFLFSVISSLSGRRVTDAIWLPLE